MAHLTFDTDTQMDELLALYPPVKEGYKSRRSVYGSKEAASYGLTPVEAVPDILVDPADYKEVLDECEKQGLFPLRAMYDTWCPKGTRYNQNGLGYCWTWSGTACMMTLRAVEEKETVLLAPVSAGYLVGWANRGNYLESFIQGARENGICPGDINDHRNQASVWQPLESKRSLYRLDKVFDTDNRSDDVMMQHAISILACSRPLMIAYLWWGHAVMCPRIRYTPGTYLNLTVDLRNSHDETDIISLTGTKMVFDEAYGFISTELTE